MNIPFLKSIKTKKWLQYFLAFLLMFTLAGCGAVQDINTGETGNESQANEILDDIQEDSAESDITPGDEESLPKDGAYTTKDDVALYIHLYGSLPSNFITKKEAQSLGWEGGSLEPYAPGKCIGGSHFGNYEGILPEKDGRSYTECDIDTLGADKRGPNESSFPMTAWFTIRKTIMSLLNFCMERNEHAYMYIRRGNDQGQRNAA